VREMLGLFSVELHYTVEGEYVILWGVVAVE
jgi:hypothetical protein